MDFFFEPKGVAVVGATPEPYSGGRYLLTNLTLGYQGPVYPVNPKYDEILGFKCYPKVSDIDCRNHQRSSVWTCCHAWTGWDMD